ncbi:chitinase domain-containing protein 1 [Harmonia axyridis]|uniref:chitinase domain-containing protein 1 n=1 Tax=Harmonia axyridis TaxID=115357 RepID=UPI001E277EF4|nr:chitinase domain-containing protein 1 [Harmonia axyridis]
MYYSYIILFLSLIMLTSSTLSPKSKKKQQSTEKPLVKKTTKSQSLLKGPLNETVFQRNLVNDGPLMASDILKNHLGFFRETDEYAYDGIVLGYVTPWNNHGYDIAKIFGNKFTHISPVWLQVKRNGPLNYELRGTHDIDVDWLLKVKNAGRERKLKILPRILFEGWSGQDFINLMTKEEESEKLIKMLVESCKKWHFDGYVLELWSSLANKIQYDLIIDFIKNIGDKLALESLDTILVVPPKRGKEHTFTENHFDELYDHVTAFSLMTYDFSTIYRPGPNAPLPWVEDCVKQVTSNLNKRSKILLGLNFYGHVYTINGGGPIVYREYLEGLKKFNGELKYDPINAEHYFDYDDGKRLLVFYPTLQSISKRLQLAKELKTGLSIWELGQGLDYFYDLL